MLGSDENDVVVVVGGPDRYAASIKATQKLFTKSLVLYMDYIKCFRTFIDNPLFGCSNP